MQARAAVLWGLNEEWQVEDVELDDPEPEEVLVRMGAAGLCHSDEHILTGDIPIALPAVGGHEGAGIVEKVGDRVTSVQPGDHVVMSFIPSCGKCRPCASGHQNLCDLGQYLMLGAPIANGVPGCGQRARASRPCRSSGALPPTKCCTRRRSSRSMPTSRSTGRRS